MKILLLNELYSMGGAEIQTRREKMVLESHGHQVLLLTLDSEIVHCWVDNQRTHYNCVVKYSNLIQKIWFRLSIDKKLEQEIKGIIDAFSPDYIHINNVADNAVTILNAVKGYKCLQTIRDYSIVCPTGFCVDGKYQVCEGYSCGECMKKCKPQGIVRTLKFMVRIKYLKTVNQLRRESINEYACPSQALTDYCNSYGFHTVCINNPFDFSILDHFKKGKQGVTRLYLYYGLVARHKGVVQLVNAFTNFAKDKDVKLCLAGKLEEAFAEEFRTYMVNPKIEYLGRLPYQETIQLLQKIDVVVVPSLWIENYPNTALEGIATRCIVLGSDRGGTKELIQSANFVFDVMNESDITAKLENVYQLSSERREEIVNSNFERIRTNNSMENYYQKLMAVLLSI